MSDIKSIEDVTDYREHSIVEWGEYAERLFYENKMLREALTLERKYLQHVDALVVQMDREAKDALHRAVNDAP